MANSNTTNDLSTYEKTQALFKSLGRMLRREDFDATDAGWTQWCDHKIRKCTKALNEAQRDMDYWKQVRGGEHLKVAAEKVSALQEALALAAKLQQEVDALKTASGKKQ